MPAIAVTDHGNTFGAFDFCKTATEAGIKPIIGIEAYVTPGTHRADKTRVRWGNPEQSDDDVSGSGAYTHMTLLVRDDRGHAQPLPAVVAARRSRATTSSRAWTASCCRPTRRASSRRPDAVGGEVQTRLRLGQYDEARAAAAEFRDIFGKENYFAEIMDHGLDDRAPHHERPAAPREGARPARSSRTNDLHYTHAARRQQPRGPAVRAVRLDARRPEPVQVRRRRVLPQVAPRRCGSSSATTPRRATTRCSIAERCEVEFNTSANYMPRFPVPDGRDRGDLVRQGGRERPAASATRPASPTRCARRPTTRPASSRRWASPATSSSSPTSSTGPRSNGIRVGPGRGSGAGSMAAYAMRITDLDPLQHGLIFERFLNPDRVSMPDFDVDFDDRRRGEVIQYVTEKYGDERVAQIVTYGTIKAKQALKDSGRVLGFPFGMGEKLTKAMPPRRHGQGHAARRACSTRTTRATRRPPTSAPSSRPMPRRKTVFDTARRPREPEAAVGRARRRRHHVERAADRHHPDHEARAGRPDRHAVRLPGVRVARPDQDGLPGAAQPHDHRRRARQHRGEPRRAARARRPRARRRGRRTSCSPAATRSACSSSTAGRCGRCCG